MILEDLMPWYKESYDFRLLEVNRYWSELYNKSLICNSNLLFLLHRSQKDVLGFSREILIAVITNIEGCEFHR